MRVSRRSAVRLPPNFREHSDQGRRAATLARDVMSKLDNFHVATGEGVFEIRQMIERERSRVFFPRA